MIAKKKGRDRGPRWLYFATSAAKRVVERGGFTPGWDALTLIAFEIIRAGEGEAFLKATRRGRPTQRQNHRYQLMRVVEQQIGAAVPRRRDDRNTPEAAKPLGVLKLSAI